MQCIIMEKHSNLKVETSETGGRIYSNANLLYTEQNF